MKIHHHTFNNHKSSTLQIGPVFISRHNPGVSCWSVDIRTRLAITSFPSLLALGNGWKKRGYLSSLCSAWKHATFHLGRYYVAISLCRESHNRTLESYLP